jgi:hypothetical protein
MASFRSLLTLQSADQSSFTYLRDSEIRLVRRTPHHRILLVFREHANPMLNECVQARGRNKSVAKKVRFAELDAFDNRLGEGAVTPVAALGRQLAAGRGRKDNKPAVLGRRYLDRGYGKPTQFLAADNDDFIRDNKSEEELRVQLFADFEQIFPEYEMVPRKRLTVIDGTIETT